MIKDVAKLVIKMTMYPSNDELRGAVEVYLQSNHEEFFNKYSEHQWTAFYNKKIHKNVSSFFYF